MRGRRRGSYDGWLAAGNVGDFSAYLASRLKRARPDPKPLRSDRAGVAGQGDGSVIDLIQCYMFCAPAMCTPTPGTTAMDWYKTGTNLWCAESVIRWQYSATVSRMSSETWFRRTAWGPESGQD